MSNLPPSFASPWSLKKTPIYKTLKRPDLPCPTWLLIFSLLFSSSPLLPPQKKNNKKHHWNIPGLHQEKKTKPPPTSIFETQARKVDPFPGWDLTESSPPCFATTCGQRASRKRCPTPGRSTRVKKVSLETGGSVLSDMELFQKIVGVVQKQIPIAFEILKGFMFNVVRGCWMPFIALNHL